MMMFSINSSQYSLRTSVFTTGNKWKATHQVLVHTTNSYNCEKVSILIGISIRYPTQSQHKVFPFLMNNSVHNMTQTSVGGDLSVSLLSPPLPAPCPVFLWPVVSQSLRYIPLWPGGLSRFGIRGPSAPATCWWDGLNTVHVGLDVSSSGYRRLGPVIITEKLVHILK